MLAITARIFLISADIIYSLSHTHTHHLTNLLSHKSSFLSNIQCLWCNKTSWGHPIAQQKCNETLKNFYVENRKSIKLLWPRSSIDGYGTIIIESTYWMWKQCFQNTHIPNVIRYRIEFYIIIFLGTCSIILWHIRYSPYFQQASFPV